MDNNSIDKYIQRLEQLQNLYKKGEGQHNAFGIAINEAKEMLVSKNESLHDVSEILDYEINSSWIASKVSNKYFQKLLGSYFAWKVIGKHNRYLINKYWKKAINSSC